MMAKISFSGLDGYMESLRRLGADSEEVSKKALYEGVKITADIIRDEVSKLPTDERWGTQDKPAKGIKEGQKQALLDGLGVAKFQEDGGNIDALIGFSGYSNFPTAKFPNGQPLALIARVAESGTSFSKKTPFVAKAVRRAKTQAETKMKEVLESEIENIMNR